VILCAAFWLIRSINALSLSNNWNFLNIIMDFHLRPIGIIHTPFTEKSHTPIQASLSQAAGTVEVHQEFVAGLQDLEGFSHIILLYVFHESSDYSLLVKPFLDDQLRGLFATRYPARPNPIGLSVVKLISRQGFILQVEGLDMLDGTPLLDIKPYVPDFDVRTGTRSGWYESFKM
jgi:tRNA (adenine37-N6)-methyltransferase